MAHTHTYSRANKSCSSKEPDKFLAEAETLVRERGQKLTPIRRKVLQLLLESEEPAKAYDLLANLDGLGAAKPPTIYRALEFLQGMGLAHKIESLNAYVACGHPDHPHSAVFLICDGCGGAQELHANATNRSLTNEAKSTGFLVENTVIEARGLCQNCHA